MDDITSVDPDDGIEHKIDSVSVMQKVCVIGNLALDESVMSAAKSFGVPVEVSATGIEHLSANISNPCSIVFIVEDMEGPIAEAPHHPRISVLGRTALLEIARKNEGLPDITRPLYTNSMTGSVVCFTGFRKKDQLMKLVRLVQGMGGSIRKDMSSRVTHLIANVCGGEKYQYALTFRVPIMGENWVLAAWDHRNEIGFNATAQDFMAGMKLKPFQGAKVCFIGFPEAEKTHMEEVLLQNGGTAADLVDCSHIVVESCEAYSLLKAKLVPLVPAPEHSKHLPLPLPPDPHPPPVPPQRRKSSFLRLFLTPNKCPVIREEDGSVSPLLPEAKGPFLSQSADASNYQTPRLSSDIETEKIPCFPKVGELPSSTPLNNQLECLNEEHSSDDMLTAEGWDTTDHSREDMCPLSPGGQAVLCEGTGDISLKNKPPTPPPPPLPLPSGPKPASTKPYLAPAEDAMVCDEEDPTSACPVVDEVDVPVPPAANTRSFIVKAEWFWVSVQNEGCADEKDYLFEDYVEAVMSPAGSRDSLGTPTSTRLRKRKRLRDPASRVPVDSPSIHKRRSSVSDAGLLSMSGSFLDCSAVSEKAPPDEVEAATIKSLSPRQQVFLELVQTEANYVGILHTIMTLIKAPLENIPMEDDPLLDNTELKTIFGHLPPIYELHSRMLQELRWANAHWTDSTSTGNIILKYAPDMVKAYPPFVNFFEQTKEMLKKCDETKPRFHAFLKVCQSKPECGRQTLGELLIRPVQRLPSISLLLGDILKHTHKSSTDHTALEAALNNIREVMTHINEDKRRMDACMDIFSIFNDIENCPPHLVSYHRSFVTRCDVIELSNELSGRGDGLVLFLFSDILEVCKKRSRAVGSLKSPNTATLRNTKHFKHVRLIPLSDIKRVFDVQERDAETEETHNAFALKCRSNQELKEKLYSFSLADEDVDKLSFLHTLCRQLANTVCKADAAYFLAPLDYSELDVGSTDAGFGTLSKAFKLASRTKMKIGRTFSFNKTPSKLKRAVSTMMSPFGSTTNLTPSSQLAQMRLASCTNLNELGAPSDPEALKPPMSVQPRRKNSKSSSLSMASFRRL